MFENLSSGSRKDSWMNKRKLLSNSDQTYKTLHSNCSMLTCLIKFCILEFMNSGSRKIWKIEKRIYVPIVVKLMKHFICIVNCYITWFRSVCFKMLTVIHERSREKKTDNLGCHRDQTYEKFCIVTRLLFWFSLVSLKMLSSANEESRE